MVEQEKSKAMHELERMVSEWVHRTSTELEITDWLNFVFKNLSSGKIVKPGTCTCEELWNAIDITISEYEFERHKRIGIEPIIDPKQQERPYPEYHAIQHPIVPTYDKLLHDRLFCDNRWAPDKKSKDEIDKYDFSTFLARSLIENGVMGDPDGLTYLKGNDVVSENRLGPRCDYGRRMCKSTAPHIKTIRFEIDIPKLLEFRDVYYDREGAMDGLIVKETFGKYPELGKTFAVRGGIPFEAVNDFGFVKWSQVNEVPNSL